MSMISPCKGCADRYLACHGSCDRYKEWKAELLAEQKHLTANKHKFNVPWSASHDRVASQHSRYGRDGFKRGGDQ